MARRKTGRVLSLLGCVLVLASQFNLAQEGLVKLESNLVSLDVTIVDHEGNHVTDLRKEDFGILHDGIPQPVVFFEADLQRKLSRPLAVVFALDMSGSLGRQIADQQHAAHQFVSLIQHQSVFAVIGFNDKVRVLQKFTNDPALVEKAFEKAGEIGGRTKLYDALDRAVTMLVKDAPEKRSGRRLRRVVIVITDGFDYTSTVDRAELIRRANTADVTVYSVTLPSYVLSVTGRRRVPTLLDASGIVAQTGGRDFSAEERDFTPIFQAIAEEMKASYILAYYPPNEHRQDGKFHQVTVTLNRPDLIVRQSRQGFLSPGR
jgi:VWFA-related protein